MNDSFTSIAPFQDAQHLQPALIIEIEQAITTLLPWPLSEPANQSTGETLMLQRVSRYA